MTKAYGIALKHCFGMKEKAVDVYMADTSGSRQRPIAGSNVPSQARIGLATHENLATMFQGAGLDEATGRFEAKFLESVGTSQIGDKWSHFSDLTKFLEIHLGQAILEALFGTLLTQQKDFVEDIFEYDRHVMDLARKFPSLLAPRAHRARKKVLRSIKNWHSQCQAYERLENEKRDDATDTPWITDAMVERHRILSQIEGQDGDAVASADLALIWA
jgi:hypothetical protein